MKILVAVKRVIDPYVKIRIKNDHSGVETQSVKMAMNPFDEIAVEEAVRLKEKHSNVEIIVVSIGKESSQETIRHGLVLGADRGILIETEELFSPLNIAKILKALTLQITPDLVLMGKQAIDEDNNQTPQMLAGLLNWPQATFVSQVILKDSTQIEATREVDGGLETLLVTLPAVVSTDLRLNVPRYTSLPNIMKAKSKPIEKLPLSSLNLDLKHDQQVLQVSPPKQRRAGIKVESVADLLNKLRHEAKVLP